jgi:hypothetical protein
MPVVGARDRARTGAAPAGAPPSRGGFGLRLARSMARDGNPPGHVAAPVTGTPGGCSSPDAKSPLGARATWVAGARAASLACTGTWEKSVPKPAPGDADPVTCLVSPGTGTCGRRSSPGAGRGRFACGSADRLVVRAATAV